MAQSKQTKKFEKNKLHDVIKSRKNVAKIKQKKQMDVKKKERKARDNERADGVDDGSKKPSSRAEREDKLGEMSMDQFFEGGFQVPEMAKSSTKPKTGKRKRTPIENGDAAGSDAEMAETNGGAEESASDSDSGDDADAHMEQLAGLEEKDPEFYKYLKHNDAELLDFAEDADLAEIDALSASEDESTPRKKKKKTKKAVVEAESDDDEEATTGNEVTKKLIKKWKDSMEANSSLRAMREVVLAFRTAAHLNDDEGKNYKYTISDPDGTNPPRKILGILANVA
jgi:nucleolar complex protein 2